MQAPPAREKFGDISIGRDRLQPMPPVLHAQALASLSTTGRQDGTAALGGHTGAEPVALRTLASVRLIGALHNQIPFMVKVQLAKYISCTLRVKALTRSKRQYFNLSAERGGGGEEKRSHAGDPSLFSTSKQERLCPSYLLHE